MDEPLSALDAELKISMRRVIQDVHRMTGATIIYVTHDQSEALAMADRILIMKNGKIEQGRRHLRRFICIHRLNLQRPL